MKNKIKETVKRLFGVRSSRVLREYLSKARYKQIKNDLTDNEPLNLPELYICKDIVCKYEQKYCCMSCGQRFECEAVCDYNGPCDWRVKDGEN